MKRNSLFFTVYCLLSIIFSANIIEVGAQSKRDRKAAQKLTIEGEKSFQQKDYQAAISKYAQAATLTPINPAAHFWKGYAHFYLNEFDQSLGELDTALAQGYTPLDVYKVRWLLNFQKKNYDQALEDARKILQSEPSNQTLNSAVGEIYFAKNSFDEALVAFQKAIQFDSNNADAYYYIALIYRNSGDFQMQRLNAAEAVKRNTKYAGESYFLLGDAWQKLQNYNEAVAAYRKSLSIKPDSKTTYQNLADIYRRLNRFAEAVEVIEKAVETFPDDGSLDVDLSRYYSLADRSAEAVGAAEKAVKLLPNKPAALTSLCRAYYENRQFTPALETCNSALKLNPEDGETNIYLGFTYLSLDKTQPANEYFKKAVTGLKDYTQKNPEYFDGFYLLGNAYYYSNQPENAVEAYSRSLQLNIQSAKARFNLGLAYFVGGKKTAAREQYEVLLQLDKDLAAKLKQVIDKK